MAKVDTVTFKIFQNSYAIPVYFHPSDNRFFLEIPKELAIELYGDKASAALNPTEFYGFNFKETLNQLREKIKEREEMTLEEHKEKVILYEIDMDCAFEYKSNTGRKKRLYIGSTHRGTGVKLKYRILWKQTFAGETKYKDLDGRCQIYKDSDEKEMVWSEQREAFFREIEDKLNMLCLQFDTFFNKQKSKELLKVIDAGTKNLLQAPGVKS